MWFDANSGINYTLGGTSENIRVGVGLASGGRLITVISNGTKVVETNINRPLVVDNGVLWRDFWITNNSRGGLRFGHNVWIGMQHLKIAGSGATHFAGWSLFGTSLGDVPTGSISTVTSSTPHLILSSIGTHALYPWTGALNVGAETLVFIKRNGALGTGANVVASGGTLGFRSHAGATLNYNYVNTASLQVSGTGAVRAWGQPAVGAIYHDGGGSPTNLNTFTGDIQLAGHTYFGARGDAAGLHLSGKITSSSSTSWPNGYWFIKTGPGLIALSNPNNAWLRTYIYGGVLRIVHNNALPAGNLILGGGGILELGSGNFARQLGTGNGQVRWTSASGGFSAYGAGRTVSILNSQGNLANLTWGTGGFVGDPAAALLLSSRYANAVIDFKNPINLGSGNREIHVERGHTNAYAIISGAITGTGSSRLVKTGPGMLHLTGGIDNILTRINEGALRYTPTQNGQIELNGGVLGLNADFTRSIGTGAGTIRWTGSGGFAAYGGDRIVSLNNGAALNWGNWGGTTRFVDTGQELRFGHYTADGTVGWGNAINVGFSARIHVERGRNPDIADVTFVGALSSPAVTGDGGTGELTIKGNGRMDLRSPSTSLEVGVINVYGAELRLNLSGRIGAGNNRHHTVNLAYGGTLTLDNVGRHNSTTNGQYIPNRLPASTLHTSSIVLNGGTFRFWGGRTLNSRQDLYSLWLYGGANTIDLQHNAPSSWVGSFTEVKSTSLSRINPSLATLNYTSHTEDFTKVRLSFANWNESHALNEYGGTKITPWGTVNGKDFMTPLAANGATELRPVTNYEIGTSWSGRNVHVTSNSSRTNWVIPNSLKLGNAEINMNGYELRIQSGGLLTYTGTPSFLNATLSSKEYTPHYAHIYSTSLTLKGTSRFYGNGPYSQLVKTGPGTLILDSSGTHDPTDLYIQQGTVDLRQGSIRAHNIHIGDGAGRDGLILPANRTDPLAPPNRLYPNITLHGTPYGLDPSNVYGGEQSDQAILRLSGNTKQHLNWLTVTARGTIDFAGGEAGLANILWIERLIIDSGSQLFIRNWYQYEDYLLVKKVAFGEVNLPFQKELLSRIIFDGYQDFPVLAIDYDANYYQITPFHAPEPSTTGAILGAVGIGLVAWQRRRRANEPAAK